MAMNREEIVKRAKGVIDSDSLNRGWGTLHQLPDADALFLARAVLEMDQRIRELESEATFQTKRFDTISSLQSLVERLEKQVKRDE